MLEGQQAWSDEEGDEPPAQSASTRPRGLSGGTAPATSWPAAPELRPSSAASLVATCLGVLGECLEELVALGAEVLPYLPAEAKAALLAVARRRRLLGPDALLLLADAGQGVLDLSTLPGAPPLSERTICLALAQVPDLTQVDLTGRAVGGATLNLLPGGCPRLEVLRLGSPALDGSPATAAAALKRLLPVPDGRGRPAVESWDSLDPEAHLGAALAGRLARLRLLQWPAMPHSLLRHCRATCPRLLVNPSAEEAAEAAAAGDLPPAVLAVCCPSVSLDGELLRAGVARWERWDSGPQQVGSDCGRQAAPPALHIAERFRLAYAARERRLRLCAERQWWQAQRRHLRQSPAAAAIERWETSL